MEDMLRPLLMRTTTLAVVLVFDLVHGCVHPRPTVLPRTSTLHATSSSSRRAILTAAAAAATCAASPAHAAKELSLTTSASGLKWADIRLGAGPVNTPGQPITIDYMMTKRAGAKIHSTKDARQPFSWTLGDGTVIEGLELAILGSGDIKPMQPGGIRRVMVPQILGYGSKKGFFSDGTPTALNEKQPIPPKNFEWVDPYGGDRVNSYLRFKDIYMNEMRLDEPDLILDIILQSGRVDAAGAAPAAAPPAVVVAQ